MFYLFDFDNLISFFTVSSFLDYDAENPRIMTKCEHHFHMSCILEWMERSDTCAICDQVRRRSETMSSRIFYFDFGIVTA